MPRQNLVAAGALQTRVGKRAPAPPLELECHSTASQFSIGWGADLWLVVVVGLGRGASWINPGLTGVFVYPRVLTMYYTAIERFDPGNGERWIGYTRWLGRTDLKRVVTLDSLLCPAVVHVESGDDWEFVAKEDFMLDFFTDLGFVLRRVAGHRPSVVVGVMREPSADEVSGFSDPDFEFAGFDVVDTQFHASALLSSSRFPGLYRVSELSAESGLIRLRKRAFEIRDTLRQRHPDCEKARCHVWAVWRYTGKV